MAAGIDSTWHRRDFLGLAAGASLYAALPMALASPARAGEQLVGSLITQARAKLAISERIAFISHALLGHRYQPNTLIGGPRQPEVFVVRDDRFDCVTFCETVLAAARAHDSASFEAELRAIRYRKGIVAWRERNHDFAAWCERNVADGVCEPVALGKTTEVKKVLDLPRALGRRSYSIAAIPKATLLAEKAKLQNGDIIGFVSRRPSLDYYHTGFVMFGGKGEFLLRHASESHWRVLDERMEQFLAINRVRYVTLLRPRGEPEKKS
jgi:D-alanyl-D-alanine carboxypeptidase/D-alanyl-D-alanine-endopeptidase (penicillin-binding protein 4)